MIVAIQPDFYGEGNASSPLWIRYLKEAGLAVRQVDVKSPDILAQVEGCRGFLWRFAHWPQMHQIARRLLPVLEEASGLTVYPDHATCWHFDDKIRQHLLLTALHLPTPETWTIYDIATAKAFCQEWTSYPLVAKLAVGAGSKNVDLVHSSGEAERLADRMFGAGLYKLADFRLDLRSMLSSQLRNIGRLLLKGQSPPTPERFWDLQKGYILFQEFLDGNTHDTRVTVIGQRAFAFRRWNRADDFRASGSGRIDYGQEGVDSRFVRLAFEAARRLGTRSCAFDFLWRQDQPVIVELSYTYDSCAVSRCPGHWTVSGEGPDADLTFVEGPMWPERAQMDDFLERLRGGR